MDGSPPGLVQRSALGVRFLESSVEKFSAAAILELALRRSRKPRNNREQAHFDRKRDECFVAQPPAVSLKVEFAKVQPIPQELPEEIQMATGAFINFELVFQVKPKDGGLNNDQQAIEILKKARHLLAVGFPVVAIIYSANEEQTRALVKAYAAGNYMAGIDGANQAKVMQALEAHLGGQDWKDLQMKVRIAPITTIPNPGTDPVQIVNADIARIRGQLDEGWAILGWQNQNTINRQDHPYAIGGGVAGSLPAATEAAIQDGLKSLAAAYPAPS